MNKKQGISILSLGLIVVGGWLATKILLAENIETDNKNVEPEKILSEAKPDLENSKDIPGVIKFIQTDNSGNESEKGGNYAILFNPRSSRLDFKVNVGLSEPIYDCLPDVDLEDNCEYIGKYFGDLIVEENSKLNGSLPFAAINADYIDAENHPQGLNISRGVEYSGDFANARSSFSLSKDGVASVQIGKLFDPSENYNTVGGNGCFWKDGEFTDICEALGEYACAENTERSMAITTTSGWVIFLVHDETKGGKLLPENFEHLLNKIAEDNDLGKIMDGILFDGGRSPNMMYDGKIYLNSTGKIGSVFLIYLK